MTSRQFDTSPPAATAERTPTRQPQAPEAEHIPAAQRNPPVPGGRLARIGAALLQLQRDHGNRYVQQVVRQAHQDEAAVGAAGGELDADLRRDLGAARHGGRRLDGTVGAPLGQALGSDFSAVRVHTDARADALTRSLRASAFTAGGDIFFRKGAYAPRTSSGRELLAHELTHVVQQGGAAGIGASAGVTIGPAGDRHEREAGRVASELAGQRHPRAPAPAEGGGVPAVQRRYLDQPKTGYATWEKDTTVKKGVSAVSRAKLALVDQVLQVVLKAKSSPQWMQVGEPMLKRLEDALNKTKYGQGATKTSPAFKKRRDAVVRLQNEAQGALSQVMIKNIVAAGDNPPATQAVQQAFDPQAYLNALMQQGLVPQQAQQVPQQAQQVPQQAQQVPQQAQQVPQQAQQQQAQPDPVAELEKVGFLRTYLTSLPTFDLDLLFEAHKALGAKDFPRAQQVFDIMNPPVASSGNAPPKGWALEPFESTIPGKIYDFARTNKGPLMAAQRQLIAHHAADIGGEYGKLLSYKPYSTTKKRAALTPQEVLAGEKYFDPQELRDWSTTIQEGQAYKLSKAKAKVHAIAAAATQASEARSTAKGRQLKAAKEPLSEAEVTALRIYTADEYREMNAVFRDFRVDQPTANWEKYSAIAKLAISGLGKLPKARNTISYRGDHDLSFGGHAGVLRFGATFTLPNFYSTTMKPEKAFPGVLGYVFHNKRAGRVVEKFSAFKTEAEVLIPPGAKFKITGEFHLQNDGNWQSQDGSPGLSAAAQLFWDSDAEKASRKTILEFTEV